MVSFGIPDCDIIPETYYNNKQLINEVLYSKETCQATPDRSPERLYNLSGQKLLNVLLTVLDYDAISVVYTLTSNIVTNCVSLVSSNSVDTC